MVIFTNEKCHNIDFGLVFYFNNIGIIWRYSHQTRTFYGNKKKVEFEKAHLKYVF